jgi:hypothetical protein
MWASVPFDIQHFLNKGNIRVNNSYVKIKEGKEEIIYNDGH